MTWTGGCLCGALRYEARSDPLRAVSCHCGMCRRASGAAVLSFVHFAKADFTWLAGEPARYRSSASAERLFCPTCGSTLGMAETVLDDRVQVALGSLDRAGEVQPDDQVWTREQLPWLVIDDDRPRFETISDAVPSQAIEEG